MKDRKSRRSNQVVAACVLAFIALAAVAILWHSISSDLEGSAEQERLREAAQSPAVEEAAEVTASRYSLLEEAGEQLYFGQHDAAIAILERVVSVYPEDTEARDLMAEAKAAKEQEILKEIEETPSDHHARLKVLYQRLSVLFPQESQYLSKAAHHTHRLDAELRLVKWKWYRVSSNVVAEGEVENIGYSSFDDVLVEVTYSTRGGEHILNAEAGLDDNPILRGQISTFRVVVPWNPEMVDGGAKIQFVDLHTGFPYQWYQ